MVVHCRCCVFVVLGDIFSLCFGVFRVPCMVLLKTYRHIVWFRFLFKFYTLFNIYFWLELQTSTRVSSTSEAG